MKIHTHERAFKHKGHNTLLGSSLDRFICARVGVCGLEMLDRKNSDTKEIETQNSQEDSQ